MYERLADFIQNTQNAAVREELQQDITTLKRLEQLYHDVAPGSPHFTDRKKTYEDFVSSLERKLEQLASQPEPECSVNFVCRTDELQTLLDRHNAQYVLLNAPMEYGKSTLLDAVKKSLDHRSSCLVVFLKSVKSYRLIEDVARAILLAMNIHCEEDERIRTPENAGSYVGEKIRELLQPGQDYVYLLLDDLESLSDHLARNLRELFLVALAQSLHVGRKHLRLILSGRYIASWNNFSRQYSSKSLKFSLMSLTPFDFPIVHSTVDEYSITKPELGADYKQNFAADIMYYTGGHPGCMAHLLSNHLGDTEIEVSRHYESLVKPAIENVKDHIERTLNGMIEDRADQRVLPGIINTLSVVRRFSVPLLEDFIKRGLIPWNEEQVFKLEELLLASSLISYKEGFLQDGITRRLLAIEMRHDDLPRFLEICEAARDFYENALNPAGNDRKNDGRREAPPRYHPEALAVEYLFQDLHFLKYKHRGSKRQLFRSLESVIELLVPSSAPSSYLQFLRSFIDELEKDWELGFTVNYLFREGWYTNGPYQELLNETREIMQERYKEYKYA